MMDQSDQNDEKDGLSVEGIIACFIFVATLSFIPFYLYGRLVWNGSKADSVKFALTCSLIGVPTMIFGIFGLSWLGGIMTYGAINGSEIDRSGGYFHAWEWWFGFLWVFGGISFVFNYVMVTRRDSNPAFHRNTYWALAVWSAFLCVCLTQLFSFLEASDPNSLEKQMKRETQVRAEQRERKNGAQPAMPAMPPQATPAPPPIQVTTMTSTGLESVFWNSQYHFLTKHRTLGLTSGQVVWDRASVWITADYNSLIEGKIRLLNSDGKGVEVDYQGLSITVQGSRTINWTRGGYREVWIGASGEMSQNF